MGRVPCFALFQSIVCAVHCALLASLVASLTSVELGESAAQGQPDRKIRVFLLLPNIILGGERHMV